MTERLVRALETRVRRLGTSPFLTWYQPREHIRIELSGRTFSNWVDKSANLAASLGCDSAPSIALPLLVTDPGHWVGLVWAMATWQMGGRVLALPRDSLKVVDLAVVGPTNTHPVPGVETVACSLHPLGLPLPAPPPSVTDFAEVLTQPDDHWADPAPAQDPAYRGLADDSRRTAGAVDDVSPLPGRRLVHIHEAADPWDVLSTTLVGPLLGDGSVVIVTGPATAGEIADIAAAEQTDADSDW